MRLRYNNSIGMIASPGLTASATTINFASAPSWSTITAPDYIPLILDPPTSSPNPSFEVVWVTAYTQGATSATIVRGQEGSTPVAHSTGAQWMVATTTGDFPIGLSYTPATAPPPSRAYRSAALTPAANTAVKIPLDTISFDPNGYMDTATNHRYNVPAAGYYHVDAQVFLAGAGGYDMQLWIYKNGAQVTQGGTTHTSGFWTAANASDVIYCQAGDYLELYVYTASSVALEINGDSNFLSVVPLTQQSIASQITPLASKGYRNTAFSFNSGAYTVVPIDTVQYDTDGALDVTTNHRWTAPVAGYYQVEANVWFGTSSGNTGLVAVLLNGNTSAPVARGDYSTTVGGSVVSTVLKLNAGDYLQLGVYSSINNTLSIQADQSTNYLAVTQVAGVTGSNLAAARAYRSAALTGLTTGAWNKVPLDTKSFDPNGNFDVTTNHRYNVPAAGPYLVVATCFTQSSNSYAGIFKNGTEVSEAGLNSSGLEAVVVDIVNCNAGDYLELYTFIGGGGTPALQTSPGSAQNYLSITPLVSATTSQSGSSSPASATNQATVVARAHVGTAGSTGTGAQKVPIDTVDYDPTASVSTTNHRFTAPAAGYYQVNGEVYVTGSANVYLYLYKNGASVTYGAPGNLTSQQDTISDLIYLNAGDYIELWVNTGSSVAYGISSSSNYLSVVLVQAPSGAGNANALPYSSSYQQGVLNPTDLQLSGLAITTGSGQLAFAVGAASQFIGKDASGLLVPVSHPATTYTVTPTTLPASGSTIVYGVEIDLSNNVYLVAGSSVAGQISTASALATNSPAITPGRNRVADVGIYNNSGTYQFSNATTVATQGTNWIDRRLWARGAAARIARNHNATGTNSSGGYTYPGSTQPIDATNLAVRVECSGAPLRFGFYGSSTGSLIAIALYMDGVRIESTACILGNVNISGEYEFTPPAGSHLFVPYWDSNTAGGTILYAEPNFGVCMTVREFPGQNANNGTS